MSNRLKWLFVVAVSVTTGCIFFWAFDSIRISLFFAFTFGYFDYRAMNAIARRRAHAKPINAQPCIQ